MEVDRVGQEPIILVPLIPVAVEAVAVLFSVGQQPEGRVSSFFLIRQLLPPITPAAVL